MNSTKEKSTHQITVIASPKRYHLFRNFSVLSLLAFVLIGYFVVSAIRPNILQFVISRQEADTVVFVNRLANNLLEPVDFLYPLTPENEDRLAVFVEGIQVPARLAVSVTNRDGFILASDIPEFIETTIATSNEFHRASIERRSVAVFKNVAPEQQELLGAEDALEMFIPVTFGTSTEVVGIVHTLSRTGFFLETMRVIEQDVVLRISAGLLFLYIILAFIVWGASRTIGSQALSLHEYATTLEMKVRDRTRDLEESTQREIAAAKEVARLKDEFVFIATHELQVPVTVMRWSLSILKNEKKVFDALPRRFHQNISMMTSSVERLRGLISDLLDVARLESGTVKVKRDTFSLEEIVRSSLAELKTLAKEKGITVYCRMVEFKKLPFVIGDADRLREVLTNLFSNAVKFNKPEGIIECSVAADDAFVEIAVRDTGIGIKKEDMEKLFSKFFRAENTMPGTGLGLWISREIMRRLNGDLVVESVEGEGSTFRMRIPVAKKE